MERYQNQETSEKSWLKERIRTLQEGEILLIRPQEESPDEGVRVRYEAENE